MSPPSISAHTLFDSGSATLATFLGTPVAGAILMAVNYRRLGKAINGVWAIVGASAVVGIVILCGDIIPRSVSSGIAIGLLLATRSTAKALQGPDVEEHVGRGGRLGSRWVAAGVGIGTLAAGFVVAVIVLTGLEIASGG